MVEMLAEGTMLFGDKGLVALGAGLGALLGIAFKRFGERPQITTQLIHVFFECFGFRRLAHYNLLLR